MHPQVTDIFSDEECPNGICVVDGYGLRLGVERGHLVVVDGIGRARRTRRFTRADRTLRRVVVIGNSGTISLDALRWLADIRVPLVHIDSEGRLLAMSAVQGTDNPALRRAQVLAVDGPVGMDLTRTHIAEKLQGQLSVARSIAAVDAVSVIEGAMDDLGRAKKLDDVLMAEAVAASVYWPALSHVPVHFTKHDQDRIPDHWRRFGQRRSPLSQSARMAVTPAHAIINYCYALLAAEARIACLTMGLDPGLGILHADKANRDSLVADVMEPVRPQVDRFVLDLVDRRTFHASEFTGTRQGVCRVLAPLTHELAESAIDWAQLLGPVVERVAATLAKESKGAVKRVSTPLTNRSRAAVYRRGLQSRKVPRQLPAPKPCPTCRICGGPVPRTDYRYCDECRILRKAEVAVLFAKAGPVAARKRREEGDDPSRTEEALAKQGVAMRRRNREAKEWAESGGQSRDPEIFRATILPAIQDLSLMKLSLATGLSRSYCRDVRSGKYVPHVRHWEAFRVLTEGASPQ